MNYTKFLGVAAISTLIAGGMATTTASAEEVVGQTKETPTTITIQDDTDEKDPLIPTDPEQTHLTLVTVPSAYNFETKIQNKNYTINGTLKDQNISVLNDRSKREWSVKAAVKENQLKRGSDTFAVTDFTLNDVKLVGTGEPGIVARSKKNPTGENNTGSIVTAMEKASIGFADQKGLLKAKDNLTGTISYQLYNTVNAE